MAPVLAATARALAIRAVVVLPFVVAMLLFLWPESIGTCLGGPPCWVSPETRLLHEIGNALVLVEVVLIVSLALDALIRRVRRP
jgi:hypothetical protein